MKLNMKALKMKSPRRSYKALEMTNLNLKIENADLDYRIDKCWNDEAYAYVVSYNLYDESAPDLGRGEVTWAAVVGTEDEVLNYIFQAVLMPVVFCPEEPERVCDFYGQGVVYKTRCGFKLRVTVEPTPILKMKGE